MVVVGYANEAAHVGTLLGLLPDSYLSFELCIEAGSHSMLMKRWLQGELDNFHKQVAFLIDQGWIILSSASHMPIWLLLCWFPWPRQLRALYLC